MLTGLDRRGGTCSTLAPAASGFLLKDADPTRLPHALRGVLDGEAALPRTLTARLIEEFRERGRRRGCGSGADGPSSDPPGVGRPRASHERRITAEMADRLTISPVTVRRPTCP
jgi:DNA-binding NarL/FixJ family response regulator